MQKQLVGASEQTLGKISLIKNQKIFNINEIKTITESQFNNVGKIIETNESLLSKINKLKSISGEVANFKNEIINFNKKYLNLKPSIEGLINKINKNNKKKILNDLEKISKTFTHDLNQFLKKSEKLAPQINKKIIYENSSSSLINYIKNKIGIFLN